MCAISMIITTKGRNAFITVQGTCDFIMHHCQIKIKNEIAIEN